MSKRGSSTVPDAEVTDLLAAEDKELAPKRGSGASVEDLEAIMDGSRRPSIGILGGVSVSRESEATAGGGRRQSSLFNPNQKRASGSAVSGAAGVRRASFNPFTAATSDGMLGQQGILGGTGGRLSGAQTTGGLQFSVLGASADGPATLSLAERSDESMTRDYSNLEFLPDAGPRGSRSVGGRSSVRTMLRYVFKFHFTSTVIVLFQRSFLN